MLFEQLTIEIRENGKFSFSREYLISWAGLASSGLTLFRMRRGTKKPPFHQNFLPFSFNPFLTIVENFKYVRSVSSKLLDLNQDHPSKKWFFWSNSYKIEIVITSLIEMLELLNFRQLTI